MGSAAGYTPAQSGVEERMRRPWLTLVGFAIAAKVTATSTFAWQDWPGEWHPGRPSVAPAVASVVAPSMAAPTEIAIGAPVFRLEVPHRTQKDGGRWQISNCGPATLGMVLDAHGLAGQETDDLRYRSHVYQGTVGMRTGTALQHVARVAEDFGIRTFGLYDDVDRFHTWSLEEVRAQLRLGRPVMPLVRLYAMPGYEGIGPRWGHYVLLTGVTEDGFFYSDSLQTDPLLGSTRTVSAAQLKRAMQLAHIPGQAVAFGGVGLASLRVSEPGR